MARRSDNDHLLIAAGAFFALLMVIGLVQVALQSWPGRLLLVVIVGGGGWLAIAAFRWLRERQRIHAQTLDQLLALSPSDFEHAVAQLLQDEGYRRVRVHGGAGDLQADVTATAADGSPVVVQCKRYAPGNKVGSPKVQSFIGMSTVHHKAARGMVVTTSSFTRPAVELARRHRIELVDGEALTRRLQRVHTAPAPRGTDATATTQPPPPTPRPSVPAPSPSRPLEPPPPPLPPSPQQVQDRPQQRPSIWTSQGPGNQ